MVIKLALGEHLRVEFFEHKHSGFFITFNSDGIQIRTDEPDKDHRVGILHSTVTPANSNPLDEWDPDPV